MLSARDSETRRWLRHLAYACAIGLGAGLVAFLAARGVTAALLLDRQRELLGSIGAFQFDGPPSADIRALRGAIEALDQRYRLVSALVGLACGALAAVVAFLRLEYRSGSTTSL